MNDVNLSAGRAGPRGGGHRPGQGQARRQRRHVGRSVADALTNQASLRARTSRPARTGRAAGAGAVREGREVGGRDAGRVDEDDLAGDRLVGRPRRDDALGDDDPVRLGQDPRAVHLVAARCCRPACWSAAACGRRSCRGGPTARRRSSRKPPWVTPGSSQRAVDDRPDRARHRDRPAVHVVGLGADLAASPRRRRPAAMHASTDSGVVQRLEQRA